MKKVTGFSLIELVFVIVILGILAATALPRFLDITEEAKDASLEGVAGGYATGVSLVRSQWEALGRPKENEKNSVLYDGRKLYLTSPTDAELGTLSPGYPITTEDENVDPSALTALQCERIWNAILQNPARITSSFSDIQSRGNYFKYYVSTTNTGSNRSCLYFLVSGLSKNSDGQLIDPGSDINSARNFLYQPATGQVLTNIN